MRNERVTLDRGGLLRRADYAAPEGERYAETAVGGRRARAVLKSVIREHHALFWDEDLSDAEDGGDSFLFNMEVEAEYPIGDREPLWSLRLELTGGESKEITFYHRMHEEPARLYWLLMDLFDEEPSGGDVPKDSRACKFFLA